jgi:hypothetical protein
MRISISKQQHRTLLENLANQLGGDPKDALEHILNCWQVGQLPAPNQPATSVSAVAVVPGDDDEMSALADWS